MNILEARMAELGINESNDPHAINKPVDYQNSDVSCPKLRRKLERKAKR